jgi:hypothetical protein
MNSRLSTLSSKPSAELHIEELVLHGFPPGDRYTISEAVESELARLLGDQGVPSSLGVDSTTDEIRGATLNISQKTKPPAIGREIARSVYGGFGQ